jgi:2-isopropylmalate synthase
MRKRKIKIFDTTLRDGEQSPGASMSIRQKVEMAMMLESLGVDRIEAGFPVSSEVQFRAVKEVSKKVKNATIVALARCVKDDIDVAYEATKEAKDKMLHLFIATSPIHRKFKLGMSKKDILKAIGENIRYAKYYFDKIEFSPEDATRTERDFLFEVIDVAIKSGATIINIPDTVGYTIPEEFSELIKSIVRNIPKISEIDLSVHCHNDLGLAVANSLAAVSSGATQVEVTVNGIGERAGNCSLEEFVMAINVRKDYLPFITNIKTEKLYNSSKLLESLTGLIIPRNKPVVGENAFLHEAGIHQHGVIKNRSTYEIIKPEQIGRGTENLVLGRHSGKHSFKKKLRYYNIKLSQEQFNKAFSKFQKIADKKKEVCDEDIFLIISSILGQYPDGYKLDCFDVKTGNNNSPSATVRIKKGKDKIISTNTGNGPIEAVFNAIDSAIGIKTKLKNYVIHGVGAGRDAQGQVKVVLEIDKNRYAGRGDSTDIIEASANAYINAVNRYNFSLETAKVLGKNSGLKKIKEVG